MTGGIYTPAWWRSYVDPMATAAIVDSADVVLAGVRHLMTGAEIVEAERLIDRQRSRLGMVPGVRRMG